MSKPFEWKDFTKKYSDLSSNNFPTFSKTNQVQDTVKFKFSSKAQKGIKFDSSATNYDATNTDADFSSKLTFEDLEGVELSVKAKSKPSTEFGVKFYDPLLPIAGASFTAKVASAATEQTLGAIAGYVNQFVNINLGFALPLHYPIFKFVETGKLGKQPKIDVDAVVKPLDSQDIYLGGTVSVTLPDSKESPFTYTGKVAAALNNKTFNGGVFVERKREKDQPQTKYGGYAYTEADDLSGGAQVTYSPSESESAYKGLGFEAVAGIQRDNDSKLSSKIQVIPDTTVSLGYEQKLSKDIKLSFGYSFLLSKTSKETKTKASAFSFGLELSH